MAAAAPAAAATSAAAAGPTPGAAPAAVARAGPTPSFVDKLRAALLATIHTNTAVPEPVLPVADEPVPVSAVDEKGATLAVAQQPHTTAAATTTAAAAAAPAETMAATASAVRLPWPALPRELCEVVVAYGAPKPWPTPLGRAALITPAGHPSGGRGAQPKPYAVEFPWVREAKTTIEPYVRALMSDPAVYGCALWDSATGIEWARTNTFTERAHLDSVTYDRRFASRVCAAIDGDASERLYCLQADDLFFVRALDEPSGPDRTLCFARGGRWLVLWRARTFVVVLVLCDGYHPGLLTITFDVNRRIVAAGR